MDGSGHRFVAEHDDHPLDLPPAAEMDDVAGIPAAAGKARRLGRREVAEFFDETRRLRQSGAVGEMHVMTQGQLSFSLCDALARQGCKIARDEGEEDIHHGLWRASRRFAMTSG